MGINTDLIVHGQMQEVGFRFGLKLLAVDNLHFNFSKVVGFHQSIGWRNSEFIYAYTVLY